MPKSLQESTVNDLRDKGYAVVVFTPEELNGASPQRVQDNLVDIGWEVIAAHTEQA